MKVASFHHILLRLLGALLVGSCILKAQAPNQAASWLTFTGLDLHTSYWLASAMGLAEGGIGVSLLVRPAWIRGRNVAAVFFFSLICIRLWAVLSGASGDCGGFGTVPIPPIVLWSILVVGFCASALNASAGSKRGLLEGEGSSKWLAWATLAAVTLAQVPPLLRGPDSPSWQAQLNAAASERFLVVGATDCSHCQELLRKVPLAMLPQVALLVRDDDRGQRAGTGLKIYRLRAEVWWSALETAPPAIFEREQEGELKRIRSDVFLRRLRR